MLNGTDFTCQLWGRVGANVSETLLELLSTTTFRTGPAVGYFHEVNLNAVLVPNAPLSGSPENPNGNPYFGTFQIRAWNNSGGTITTWAQAEAAWTTVPAGKSEVFTPPEPLGGTGNPQSPTRDLIGLTSFNLHLIPEPSTVAPGVVGAGMLLVWHRRRQNC